jgi:prepilin peptidase CpaA
MSGIARNIFLILLLIPSVWTNLAAGRISKQYSGAVLAVALAVRLGTGWGDFEEGFLSGVYAVAGTLGTYGLVALLKKGIGAQEVALIAAVGGVLGTPLHFTALIFMALLGSLQAVAMVLWHRNLAATLKGALGKKSTETRTIPYGLSIALGSVWALWWEF